MSIPFSDVAKSYHWVLLPRHAFSASTFSQSLGGASRLVVPKLQQNCTSLAAEFCNECSFYSASNNTEFFELVQSSRMQSGSIWRMIGKHCPFCQTVFGKRAWTWTSFWVRESQLFFRFIVEKVWSVGRYMLVDITNCIRKRPPSL